MEELGKPLDSRRQKSAQTAPRKRNSSKHHGNHPQSAEMAHLDLIQRATTDINDVNDLAAATSLFDILDEPYLNFDPRKRSITTMFLSEPQTPPTTLAAMSAKMLENNNSNSRKKAQLQQLASVTTSDSKQGANDDIVVSPSNDANNITAANNANNINNNNNNSSNENDDKTTQDSSLAIGNTVRAAMHAHHNSHIDSNNNNNENSSKKRGSIILKSPAMQALNNARLAVVNTLRNDRSASTRLFPVDTVCHPSVEVSMKQKVLKLNKMQSLKNLDAHAIQIRTVNAIEIPEQSATGVSAVGSVSSGAGGGRGGNTSVSNANKDDILGAAGDGVIPMDETGGNGTGGGGGGGSVSGPNSRKGSAITGRNSQALSPRDIDKIEEFHISGDIFDLTAGLRSNSIYIYNFRPIMFVFFSIIVTAITVYQDIEWFGMVVVIFYSLLALIGTIGDCFSLHKKFANNQEGFRIADNFFDFVLNVDNTYLLVPSPWGRNITFGWLYVSILMYIANRYSKYTDFENAHEWSEYSEDKGYARWAEFCADDYYGDEAHIETGACLIRHACFMTLMTFGAFSVGTAAILLPRVKTKAQTRAIEAKIILLSKFANATVYFDKVKGSIHKKVKYIINYDVNLGGFSIPWLAILLLLAMVPFACGALYIEPEFYFDIVKEERKSSKLIYWMSVPMTVLSMFGGTSVVWRLYNLYKINYLTMKSLRTAISVDSVVDLVEWWEIRKYYLFYAMPIRYTFGTYGFIYVFVLSTVEILAAVFMIVFFDDPIARYMFGQGGGFIVFISTVGLVTAMLGIMRMAVSVHIAQRSHVKMLEHERIRLEYLAVVYSYQHESQHRHEHEIQEIGLIAQNCRKLVIGMIDLIDKHDSTPRIMGIPMRPAVLAAFFTYVLAATVSIFSKIIIS